MEVKRIDPYAICWSPEGVIAVATSSSGIYLFTIDSEKVLNGSANLSTNVFNRKKLECTVVSGSDRAVSMCFGPFNVTLGYSLLAVVVESGSAYVFTRYQDLRQTIAGLYSSVCWHGSDLILASYFPIADKEVEHTETELEFGSRISIFNPEKQLSTTLDRILSGKVLDMRCKDGKLLVLLNDNSIKLYNFLTGEWKDIKEPSDIRCFGIDICDSGILSASTRSIRCGDKETLIDNNNSGVFISYKSKYAVIYANGQTANTRSTVRNNGNEVTEDAKASLDSTSLAIPKICGQCLGAAIHPSLPMGVVLVNSQSSDWQYPILSWSSVNFSVFPLKQFETPFQNISECTADAAWLCLQLHGQIDKQTLNSNLLGPVEPTHRVNSNIQATDLYMTLKDLFLSEWFSDMRYKWYLSSEEDRSGVVYKMRSEIGKALSNLNTNNYSIIDRCIMTLYSQYTSEYKDDDDVLQVTIKGDFLTESFKLNANTQQGTLISDSNREWKQCAITLLPILSSKVGRSLDNQFMRYLDLPTVIRNNETSNSGYVAEALMKAASFCIFNGTQW